MKNLFSILFLFVTLVSSSQKVETKFELSGNLTNKPFFDFYHICDKFRKRNKVVVIYYVGDNWWQVDFKGCIGYTQSPFLLINDDMTKMVDRKEKEFEINIQKGLNLKLERKRKADSIKQVELIEKKVELIEKRRTDSINQEIKRKRAREILKEIEEKEAAEKAKYIDSCTYYTDEKDEFSGLIRKSTIHYTLDNYKNGGDLNIQLRRYGKKKYVRISSDRDLGCTSPYSTNRSFVKFKLENGDIVTFYHRGDIECGEYDLLGVLTANDIVRLKKSPIKTVRMQGTDYYHDVTDLFFRNFFIKKLDCLK